ncbi:protein neprosin-like [Castanea sativa]|uniref:protein neprosin-like n=1 Tax=Castanea sativa TaxID=21020 RepID=UPI003F64FA4D
MDFERMILIVVLCLCLTSIYQVNGTRIISKEEELELERQLKLINKPPVKSIQKIEGRKIIACPSGTVPIRRTTKADLIAIRSMSNNIYSQTTKVPNMHWILISSTVMEGSSYAEMYVMNGADEKLNSITTRWMVSPGTYQGTPYSYFFTHWTIDGAQKTGCFNIRCPGFVQVDKRVYLGSEISNVSIPDGPQFEIGLSISKEEDGNWWVTKDEIKIGYFPAAIFNNFTEAKTVGWVGLAISPPNGISPPMGSGRFPDDNYRHTSQFRAIQYKDSSGVVGGPREYNYDTIIDRPNCYLMDFHGYMGEFEGYTFGFGGPGGDCGI